MAEGRGRAEWGRTSAIIAHVRAAAGDKDARPDNFNPYAIREARQRPPKRGDISVLKVFIDGRIPPGVL
jgi:hypothetical protein